MELIDIEIDYIAIGETEIDLDLEFDYTSIGEFDYTPIGEFDYTSIGETELKEILIDFDYPSINIELEAI